MAKSYPWVKFILSHALLLLTNMLLRTWPTAVSDGGINLNPKPNKKRKTPHQTIDDADGDCADEGDICLPVPKKTKKNPYNVGRRCVICLKLLGSEAVKVVTRCPTCNVYLCTEPKGNKKHSCWLNWHTVAHLENISKVNTVTPPTRSSPRRTGTNAAVRKSPPKRSNCSTSNSWPKRGRKWQSGGP